MHPSNRAWIVLAVVLGLAGPVIGQNTFTVTGPSFADALSGGPPTSPLPSASFDVGSNPSNQLFLAAAPTSGSDAFVTIASTADGCTPGATSVSSSTPVTLFACVNTTNFVRGYYVSLIGISAFGSATIPAIRVPVQVTVVPTGEIKTTPASPINLSSTSLNQAIAVQFVANNGSSGGSDQSACSDSATSSGSGSGSACIASITVDPATPPEGLWMLLSNNCSGVVLVGNTTCTIHVTADPSQLKSSATVGTTFVGHIIIESTHGDRADVVVNFLYSQAAGPALTITSGTSFSGTAGKAFQATLTASGGTQPYTWTATGLPGTLTLNQSTGAISGTPAVGSYPVMVSVQDSLGAMAGPQKVTIDIQASQTTVTQMFPHITDGFDGSIWQSDFLLLSNNSAAVTVQLIFHLDNGVKGLSIIQPNGSNSSVAGISGIVIQPFGSAFYRTLGLTFYQPRGDGLGRDRFHATDPRASRVSQKHCPEVVTRQLLRGLRAARGARHDLHVPVRQHHIHARRSADSDGPGNCQSVGRSGNAQLHGV